MWCTSSKLVCLHYRLLWKKDGYSCPAFYWVTFLLRVFPLLSCTATSLVTIMQTCIMSEVVIAVNYSQLTRHAKMNLFCSPMLMMATDVMLEMNKSLTLTSPWKDLDKFSLWWFPFYCIYRCHVVVPNFQVFVLRLPSGLVNTFTRIRGVRNSKWQVSWLRHWWCKKYHVVQSSSSLFWSLL